jgi:hypothetical protein
MSDLAVPPVPVRLMHLPTVAGLVVPWITPKASDGRYLFGVLDPARQYAALARRLCQVCGQPLGRRLVLLMRAQDLPRQCTAEPGCDPQCCSYVQAACPMVAGRMSHYRSTPPRLGPDMIPAPDTVARLGKPAPIWFAVWLADYRVVVDPLTGGLVASYAHTRPLRIRPVGGWLPAGA